MRFDNWFSVIMMVTFVLLLRGPIFLVGLVRLAGIAVLVHLTRGLARCVAGRLQFIGSLHLAGGALGPCALLVAAG